MCHNPEIELLPSTEAMLLSGVKKSMPSFLADNPIRSEERRVGKECH